jgi:hypothetical protein
MLEQKILPIIMLYKLICKFRDVLVMSKIITFFLDRNEQPFLATDEIDILDLN